MRVRRTAGKLATMLPLLGLALLFEPISCRSDHVEMVVKNSTGEPVQLLEVDYPNASFGKDALADGAEYRYRIQVEGAGAIKVSYATGNGAHTTEIAGPRLTEGEQGRLEIDLLPAGKAEFHAQVTQKP